MVNEVEAEKDKDTTNKKWTSQMLIKKQSAEQNTAHRNQIDIHDCSAGTEFFYSIIKPDKSKSCPKKAM